MKDVDFLSLRDPVLQLERDNWPSGIRRIHARFVVELDEQQRRQRVQRTTAETPTDPRSHPKRTPYGLYACIAIDSTERTWCVVLQRSDYFLVMLGTMQSSTRITAQADRPVFAHLVKLIERAHQLGRCPCCGSQAHRDGRCVTSPITSRPASRRG